MIPDFEHMASLDEETHTYTSLADPGLRLTSVSQVIKSFSRPFDEETKAGEYARKHRVKKLDVLRQWSEKRDAAASRGTLVHAEAERIANGLRVDVVVQSTFWDGQEENYINAVYKFYRENIEVGLSGPVSELRVCWPEYLIAGTVDLVCAYNGGLFVFDWKTSEKIDWFGYGDNMYAPFNRFPDSNFWRYALQLSLYQLILKRVCNFSTDGLGIIWLKKTGEYEVKFVRPIAEDILIKGLRKHVRNMEKAS